MDAEPVKQPPTQLYYIESISDGLGDGLRILTTYDEVYEARDGTEWETRIYRNDDAWQITSRYPDTDVEKAYDRFIQVSEAINDRDGADLDMEPSVFLDQAKTDGFIQSQQDGYKLKYRTEQDEVNFDNPSILNPVGGVAGYVAAGTAAGSTLGPEGLAIGGLTGALAGAADFTLSAGNATKLEKNAERPRTPIALGYRTMRTVKGKMQNWRESRRIQKQMNQYRQPDLFNAVNELHCIESRMNQNRTVEGHERRDQLQEGTPDNTLSTAMDMAFYRFDEHPGVTVTSTFDTYHDAADFLAAVTGSDAPETQPSIYVDEDAFTALFERMDAYELTEDQNILVANAHEHGNDEILTYLEETYPNLFHEHGVDYAARGDEA